VIKTDPIKCLLEKFRQAVSDSEIEEREDDSGHFAKYARRPFRPTSHMEEAEAIDSTRWRAKGQTITVSLGIGEKLIGPSTEGLRLPTLRCPSW